ncbi:hypothetical protein C5167_021773 [Papaver somniferum]|nr:hypothetical protein C5167_021773 [Papaver somniferum]
MDKGLIWETAKDLARNRGRVLSLYHQILRSLNSRKLLMNLAAKIGQESRGSCYLHARRRRGIPIPSQH